MRLECENGVVIGICRLTRVTEQNPSSVWSPAIALVAPSAFLPGFAGVEVWCDRRDHRLILFLRGRRVGFPTNGDHSLGFLYRLLECRRRCCFSPRIFPIPRLGMPREFGIPRVQRGETSTCSRQLKSGSATPKRRQNWVGFRTFELLGAAVASYLSNSLGLRKFVYT